MRGGVVARCVLRIARRISGTANMPIRAGTKLTPPSRASIPKVKRGKPDDVSSPMVEMNRPISSETKLRVSDPLPSMTAALNPRRASQKYSNEVNCSDTSASCGAATIRIIEPMIPPIDAQATEMPSARPTCPFSVRACSSCR